MSLENGTCRPKKERFILGFKFISLEIMFYYSINSIMRLPYASKTDVNNYSSEKAIMVLCDL